MLTLMVIVTTYMDQMYCSISAVFSGSVGEDVVVFVCRCAPKP